MNKDNFVDMLKELGLSQKEAAVLLGVHRRTIERWALNGIKRGPVVLVLKAWLKLHRLGLNWRPGSIQLGITDDDVKKIIDEHKINLLQR